MSDHELVSETYRLTTAGLWEEAQSTANKVQDDDLRGEALACLAQSLILQGHISKAESVLSLVPNDSGHEGAMAEKAIALGSIPRVLWSQGDPTAARAAILEAEMMVDFLDRVDLEPYYSADILLELGKVARDLGQFDWTHRFWRRGANWTAKAIDHVDSQKVIASIAIAFTEIGDLETATEVASFLPPGGFKEKLDAKIRLALRFDRQPWT